ncbi:MAG: restriction endonuclease subunit S [Actinomycetota bacterium]
MAVEANESGRKRGWLYSPDFPEEWERRPLYSLAQWVNGLAFRNIQFSSKGMPVIKIAEMKDGITAQTKLTQQAFDPSVRIRAGDLLFSWSGQPETSIDAFWWRGPDGWLNQHVFRVTPKDDVDTVFFYYLLKYLRPQFVGIARNKQTTGLGHVTKRDLESIEAVCPPKSEQLAIARILGALDDKIELNRRMNETLEDIARAIFKSWFVDFDPVRAKSAGRDLGLPADIAALFPDSFEDSDVGQIPSGWTVVPLPDAIEVNPTRSLRKGEVAPYLDMANMPTRGHSPNSVIDRPFGSGMRFVNGDTLVARITPCLENGKTAFVDFLRDEQVGWGSTEYLVLRPKPPLPPEFAYCLARSNDLRDFAIQSMTGSSGRQRVPAESLSDYRVVTAPAPVLELFGKLIKPLFARANGSAEESRVLASLRDTLLPKLIAGEVRVPGPMIVSSPA